jgi:hypothetical protein
VALEVAAASAGSEKWLDGGRNWTMRAEGVADAAVGFVG